MGINLPSKFRSKSISAQSFDFTSFEYKARRSWHNSAGLNNCNNCNVVWKRLHKQVKKSTLLGQTWFKLPQNHCHYGIVQHIELRNGDGLTLWPQTWNPVNDWKHVQYRCTCRSEIQSRAVHMLIKLCFDRFHANVRILIECLLNYAMMCQSEYLECDTAATVPTKITSETLGKTSLVNTNQGLTCSHYSTFWPMKTVSFEILSRYPKSATGHRFPCPFQTEEDGHQLKTWLKHAFGRCDRHSKGIHQYRNILVQSASRFEFDAMV